MPRKRPRKRIAAAPRPRPRAQWPNQVWCYDFVFDHFANGQQLKCLTVADRVHQGRLGDRCRRPHPLRPRHRGVVTPGEARGAPRFLRSDNGPEFVSKALLSWIVTPGIGTALIEPGKPWQNGVAESFNGKFRDECLSLEWFRCARRGEGSDRRMAATLRRGSPAFEPRLSHAERVRGSRNKASAPPCNGPGRYGIWGLPRPGPCSTVPAGTNAASKGSRLKLTVVRRTWAGQGRQPRKSERSPTSGQ